MFVFILSSNYVFFSIHTRTLTSAETQVAMNNCLSPCWRYKKYLAIDMINLCSSFQVKYFSCLSCPILGGYNDRLHQRTLTVGGSTTVWLVSSSTKLDQTASLNTNKIIFPSLVRFSLVKLVTSRTVILPPTVCSDYMLNHSQRTLNVSGRFLSPTERMGILNNHA